MPRVGCAVWLMIGLAACGGRSDHSRSTSTAGGSGGGGQPHAATSAGRATASSGSTAAGSGGQPSTMSITSGSTTANTSSHGSGGADSNSSIGSTHGNSSGAGQASEEILGCEGFAVTFREATCEQCRSGADAECAVLFDPIWTECVGAMRCVERHCWYSCGAHCEADFCTCLTDCLPEGSSACRDHFERLTRCYSDRCYKACGTLY